MVLAHWTLLDVTASQWTAFFALLTALATGVLAYGAFRLARREGERRDRELKWQTEQREHDRNLQADLVKDQQHRDGLIEAAKVTITRVNDSTGDRLRLHNGSDWVWQNIGVFIVTEHTPEMGEYKPGDEEGLRAAWHSVVGQAVDEDKIVHLLAFGRVDREAVAQVGLDRLGRQPINSAVAVMNTPDRAICNTPGSEPGQGVEHGTKRVGQLDDITDDRGRQDARCVAGRLLRSVDVVGGTIDELLRSTSPIGWYVR